MSDEIKKRVKSDAKQEIRLKGRQTRRIAEYRKESAKGAKRFEGVSPTVSIKNDGRSDILVIGKESPALRLKKGLAMAGSSRFGLIIFAVVMTILSSVALISKSEYGKYTVFVLDRFPGLRDVPKFFPDGAPSRLFDLLLKFGTIVGCYFGFSVAYILFLFVLYSFVRLSSFTETGRPLCIAADHDKTFRLWKKDARYAFEVSKKNLKIIIKYFTYKKPYGTGTVTVSGNKGSKKGEHRDEDLFLFEYDLTDSDARTVEAFKRTNRIQGEIFDEGISKVFCDPSIREIALTDAAREGKMKKGRRLLELGFDPNTRPERWDAPIIAAARYGHLDFIRMLLEYGADPDMCDGDGKDVAAWFKKGSGKNKEADTQALNTMLAEARKTR